MPSDTINFGDPMQTPIYLPPDTPINWELPNDYFAQISPAQQSEINAESTDLEENIKLFDGRLNVRICVYANPAAYGSKKRLTIQLRSIAKEGDDGQIIDSKRLTEAIEFELKTFLTRDENGIKLLKFSHENCDIVAINEPRTINDVKKVLEEYFTQFLVKVDYSRLLVDPKNPRVAGAPSTSVAETITEKLKGSYKGEVSGAVSGMIKNTATLFDLALKDAPELRFDEPDLEENPDLSGFEDGINGVINALSGDNNPFVEPGNVDNNTGTLTAPLRLDALPFTEPDVTQPLASLTPEALKEQKIEEITEIFSHHAGHIFQDKAQLAQAVEDAYYLTFENARSNLKPDVRRFINLVVNAVNADHEIKTANGNCDASALIGEQAKLKLQDNAELCKALQDKFGLAEISATHTLSRP